MAKKTAEKIIRPDSEIKDIVTQELKSVLSDLDLDKSQVRRILEKDHKLGFSDGIRKSMLDILMKMSEPAPERHHDSTPSKDSYPHDYKPTPLDEQIRRLLIFFPQLKAPKKSMVKEFLPYGFAAESYFAIPRWNLLSEDYSRAMKVVTDHLSKNRTDRFSEWLWYGSKKSAFEGKTLGKFQQLADEQKDSDILIVPAQFGAWRDVSFKRMRQIYLTHEFGLDPFSVACMLLTSPQRFRNYRDLNVACPGYVFSTGEADSPENKIACFIYEKDGLSLKLIGESEHKGGSATAFYK